MKLKHKIPLILFVAFIAIIFSTGVYFLSGAAAIREKTQFEMGMAISSAKAQAVKSFFDIRIAELKALESEIIGLRELGDDQKLQILTGAISSLSIRGVAVSNVFVAFERGAYFSAGKTDRGAVFNVDAFLPLAGGIELNIEESYVVDPDEDEWYTGARSSMKVHLTEPYDWTFPSENIARSMVTMSAPIVIDGKFAGVVGIDMDLAMLQQEVFVEMQDASTGSYATLVSHEGLQAVHPDDKMMLTEICIDMKASEQAALKEAIKRGERYRVVGKCGKSGELLLTSYSPVLPKELELPWSLGSVYPLAAMKTESDKQVNQLLFVGLICVVTWGVFLLMFMAGVFGRITGTIDTLGQMTEGDGNLAIRLNERGKDEFGQMAKGLNRLIEKLHTMVSLTQKDAKNLLDVSGNLHGLAHSISKTSKDALKLSSDASLASTEASREVNTIASDTERISADVCELMATAEQMSVSMRSITHAMEETKSHFMRIMESVNESRATATDAAEKAGDATKVISDFNAMVDKIGSVTDIIKGVANKTNLLALNAAVEAARAGDAGKGFAVVAGEVKTLASQSAASADDINQIVEDIQSGARRTASVVGSVSETIVKINNSVAHMVSSIEKLHILSNKVADNTKQTNEGTEYVVKTIDRVAKSLEQSADSASIVAEKTKIVSDDIDVIYKDAQKTSENSATLEKTAAGLKSLARDLETIVSKFKT